MLKFLFIRAIILFIVSVSCDTSPYTCDKNIVPCGCGRVPVGINARIVNGENSIPDSWPMMVSLRENDRSSEHICGGTILGESYILTAAHCVTDRFTGIVVENISIAAGVHSLSQPDQIMRQVDKIIVHPLWKKLHREIQYDIAILHLAEPLDLAPSSSISRTCLPPRQNTLEDMMQYPLNGTSLVVIGWGQLSTSGANPYILQQVTVSSIHHFDKICANSIHDPSVQFCAGLYEGGKSACYGDSGGPIFQWIGDRWEQVGIVSYGEDGCATEGYPAVYTRISYFHDWIQSHILDDQITDSRVLYDCLPSKDECGCSRRNVVLPSSRIMTSEDALPYSWSMIVSLRVGSSNQHICSGTILDDSYILTAAHCLTNRSAQDITIEGGMYYLSESDVSIRQVDQIYIHPNYTTYSNVYKNDIAILHISFPLSLLYDSYDKKKVARTCLPAIGDQWLDQIQRPSNGTRLILTDWHITNMSKSEKPQILQQADIYAIDDENSNCSVSDDQRQLQFCAGLYQNDKAICHGDVFGDPIFQWTGSYWNQIGLGSYCRVSDKLGVFTNLAAYSSWIKSISDPPVIQSSNTYQCDKKAPCGCGQTDVNITVSGVISSDNVVEHSWPMIVSIRDDGGHFCTGSILSDSLILTSAYCARYSNIANSLTIIADIPGTGTVPRQVDKVYIHPNYSLSEPNLHDIAILHLDQLLILDNKPSKTCVPNESKLPTANYPKPNSLLAVIGYDRIESNNTMLYTLRQISATVLESEHQLCPRFEFNSTYQFCAKPPNNRSRRISYLCRGSSGGPVMIYENNHWEQIGIIPGSFNCYSSDEGKVYIRLSPYLSWIKNVTNSSFTTYPLHPEWIENITNASFTTSTKPNSNSGIINQQRNSLIFEVLFLLIIILL